MKAYGADIMFDVATADRFPGALRNQARAWLRTRKFERVSTPEAAVAAALLVAPSCKVRKALVKRAENVGDARSKELLQEFARGQGCGAKESKPCNACLDSKAVQTTIQVIEQRLEASRAELPK
jgi:hypothetical protein